MIVVICQRGPVPYEIARAMMAGADALAFVASAKMHVPPSKIADYLAFDCPLEDAYRLDMTFSGGRRAHVFAAWLHPFKEHRLVVVGETGMLVFEDSATKGMMLKKHF